MYRTILLVGGALGVFCAAAPAEREGPVLHSPDGRIEVRIEVADGMPTWAVLRDGISLLEPGRLGMEVGGSGVPEVAGVSWKTSEHEERVATTWGKCAGYDDHYRQGIWELREAIGAKRSWRVVLRAYDSGVALRYEFPDGGGWGEKLRLTGEQTEFRFATDGRAWCYDGEHDPKGPQPLSEFHGGKGARPPLVVECGQLTCDFHDGPVPPSGDRRTWPNYLAREFCHSQSDALRVFSPTGFCEQVFVNMLAGPLDMCNGLFTLNNPAEDRPKIFRNVESTVVAETARVMITFSGMAILPDCPEAYEAKADLFDFLKNMPGTWDETRILHGRIGEYITTARRSGRNWYIASANNEQARTLDVKLDFLDEGTAYTAKLYEDAPDAHFQTRREAYRVRETSAVKGVTIKATMADGGGHCIKIVPVQ